MRSSQRGKKKVQPKKQVTIPAFSKSLKSFQGYLEGTGKSRHTIASYRLDLQHFQKFMGDVFSVQNITRRDLERYHDFMKGEGYKNNTRRRRLMTMRKFMAYVTKRSKLEVDVAKKLMTPDKVERIPQYFDTAEVITLIRELPHDQKLNNRNRLLLWVLAETGCQVHELARLMWDQVNFKTEEIEFLGKSKRLVKVSHALVSALLKTKSEGERYCFEGFNRFGSLGGPITPRGIELLVQSYQSKLGLVNVTPRHFRHSAAIYWYKQGVSELDIQKRLGLKTVYSFRIYAPIFASLEATKSKNEATSIS